MPVSEQEVYARLGDEGFARIVASFYALVPGDDILGPMYAASLERTGETHADAERRLRQFLIQRFGGPGDYSAARGHPRLRMRHAPFAINVAAAKRWLELMDRAMAEAGVEEEVAAALRPYFRSTAAHMINRE